MNYDLIKKREKLEQQILSAERLEPTTQEARETVKEWLTERRAEWKLLTGLEWKSPNKQSEK